jgi:regulatory protein
VRSAVSPGATTRAPSWRKLGRAGEPAEIEASSIACVELGLQSDAATPRPSCAARRPLRRRRLRSELVRRGIDRDLIDEALAERVRRIRDRTGPRAARPLRHAPADAREWARQARFLQGRGFSTEMIRRVLKEHPGDEPA